MPDISLIPFAGMNTEAEDASLLIGGRNRRHYLRDAVNVNITGAGKAELRPAPLKVSDVPFRNIWQSPLHGDTFATVGNRWVRVDTGSWNYEELAIVGEGDAWHTVLNNMVVVAAPAGLFTFNGAQAGRLAVDNPAQPFLTTGADGALPAGKYGVAVAWLRGEQESGLSEMAQADVPENGSIQVALPMAMDPSITGARLYMTSPNGGELRREKDYPAGSGPIGIPVEPRLGAAAQFRYLSRMPTGKYLGYWRGRLVTATANILRFSEALAYHLHDERHGFVAMPQRITFVIPVTGGLWVGQSDHVTFLRGSSPDGLTRERKASKPPVPGSAILAEANALGAELAQGGDGAAVWLAANGYVVGTAQGALVEPQRQVMGGITAEKGTSVVLEDRLLTAVT